MGILINVDYVYVYTKYCIRYPLSEREVGVYPNRDAARACLRASLEAVCGCSWELIPKKFGEMLDAFTPDNVVICNKDGYMEVYNIDAKPIMSGRREVRHELDKV